ncbi:hypothetical protein PsAD5_03324 [Pseudovibrio sp. Ad5]|uniref:hypothetical protein n=1 Tax=Pseudovibrio sp. Ad5 TaxID=989436 RepID=UPI0007AE4643|nr:hypothetical protein [Pseudovibrio sp. Ad5]KZK92962.1 hypothetical protein PsAD5_03324 [Pseudovibrio sp. Ad5]
MSKGRWLKKYTKIEYLTDILKDKELHLGHPSSWDDKNDSEVIQLYATGRRDDFDIRATCLTQASDRFHFWHIFGERENGVCLWFEKDAFIKDIEEDPSLIASPIQYPNKRDLPQTKPDEVPFTKREQYADEKEFRILRVSSPDGIAHDKFRFSASSLRRIYFNPWLSRERLDSHKRFLKRHLRGDLSDVMLKQNRSLKHQKWINKLSASSCD